MTAQRGRFCTTSRQREASQAAPPTRTSHISFPHTPRLCRSPLLGTQGQVAVGTNSCRRARGSTTSSCAVSVPTAASSCARVARSTFGEYLAPAKLTPSGTYCLLVVATLLDIITPELLHNVDKFIAACQTFEGGFACSSYAFDDSHRVAMAEAHGGYTSCSIFSHFLLSSVQPPKRLKSLPESYPVPIDVDSALRWNALMQGEASEAGGFRGRSNKLVDGCYSWWVGGSFPVLEELHRRQTEAKEGKSNGTGQAKIVLVDDDGEDEWADEPSMQALFNRGRRRICYVVDTQSLCKSTFFSPLRDPRARAEVSVISQARDPTCTTPATTSRACQSHSTASLTRPPRWRSTARRSRRARDCPLSSQRHQRAGGSRRRIAKPPAARSGPTSVAGSRTRRPTSLSEDPGAES